MVGVSGVVREEGMFEVHFKVHYISPNEKEMEDTVRIRNCGATFKKFKGMPSHGIGSMLGEEG